MTTQQQARITKDEQVWLWGRFFHHYISRPCLPAAAVLFFVAIWLPSDFGYIAGRLAATGAVLTFAGLLSLAIGAMLKDSGSRP